MTFLSSLIGALLGGMIGGGMWFAVTHFFRIEAEWMAVVCALLVVGGARAAIPQGSRIFHGAGIAALFAQVATIVALIVGSSIFYVQTYRTNSDDLVIARFARNMLVTWASEGRELDWYAVSPAVLDGVPPFAPTGETKMRDLFPSEVWQRAEASWNALSTQQRTECRTYPGVECRADQISVFADAAVAEMERRGAPLLYPKRDDPEMFLATNGYPRDIWQTAMFEFESLSEADRAEFLTLARAHWDAHRLAEEHHLLVSAMKSRLSPIGYIWVAFSLLLTFVLASRNNSKFAAGAAGQGDWDAPARGLPKGSAAASSASGSCSGSESGPSGFVFYEHRGADDDGPSLLANARPPDDAEDADENVNAGAECGTRNRSTSEALNSNEVEIASDATTSASEALDEPVADTATEHEVKQPAGSDSPADAAPDPGRCKFEVNPEPRTTVEPGGATPSGGFFMPSSMASDNVAPASPTPEASQDAEADASSPADPENSDRSNDNRAAAA